MQHTRLIGSVLKRFSLHCSSTGRPRRPISTLLRVLQCLFYTRTPARLSHRIRTCATSTLPRTPHQTAILRICTCAWTVGVVAWLLFSALGEYERGACLNRLPTSRAGFCLPRQLVVTLRDLRNIPPLPTQQCTNAHPHTPYLHRRIKNTKSLSA